MQIAEKLRNLESKDEKVENSSGSEEEDEDDEALMVYCEKKKKRKRLSSNLEFFEHELMEKPKGHFQVFQAKMRTSDNIEIPLYLHVVRDSKIVYRVSTKYGAKPTGQLNFTNKDRTTGKRSKVFVHTSKAHLTYRKKLGYNDQSDTKRSRLGLSLRYYRRWPQKLLAKNWEDGLINAYNNFLIDPSCPTEPWFEWLTKLVQEWVEAGDDLRQRKKDPVYRRLRLTSRNKKPRPGSDEVLAIGEKCRGGLAGHKQFSNPSRQCAFCGRRRAPYLVECTYA